MYKSTITNCFFTVFPFENSFYFISGSMLRHGNLSSSHKHDRTWWVRVNGYDQTRQRHTTLVRF